MTADPDVGATGTGWLADAMLMRRALEPRRAIHPTWWRQLLSEGFPSCVWESKGAQYHLARHFGLLDLSGAFHLAIAEGGGRRSLVALDWLTAESLALHVGVALVGRAFRCLVRRQDISVVRTNLGEPLYHFALMRAPMICAGDLSPGFDPLGDDCRGALSVLGARVVCQALGSDQAVWERLRFKFAADVVHLVEQGHFVEMVDPWGVVVRTLRESQPRWYSLLAART